MSVGLRLLRRPMETAAQSLSARPLWRERSWGIWRTCFALCRPRPRLPVLLEPAVAGYKSLRTRSAVCSKLGLPRFKRNTVFPESCSSVDRRAIGRLVVMYFDGRTGVEKQELGSVSARVTI